MNLKAPLFVLFATYNLTDTPDTTEARYNKIPKSEAVHLTNIMNEARRDIKVPAAAMHRVSYDFDLQKQIERFRDEIGPKWMFMKNQSKARYNGQVLMDYEPFKTNFPNHDFLIHDGCQSNANAVSKIFIYRAINQRPYFNYNNCNKTGFIQGPGYINSHKSCEAAKYPAVSNKPYSWVWQYYPKLVSENITKIACILTGIPGDNAAGYRPNHFFCYRNNATPQINELPYKAGKSMSACPSGTKKAHKLCV